VHPQLLDKEIATLFANTFMALYYEYMMGNLKQQFTHNMVVAIRNKGW
jgi:hypothetical protein